MITRRERIRQAAIDEIKVIAWQIINEQGSADVTLNEITKRMGMTPPAFYGYFKNREELLKTLIIDSYHSYQEALEKGLDSAADKSIADQLVSVFIAYWHWAIENPVAFGLYAGRPVYGINPPEESVIREAEKVNLFFINLYRIAWKKGMIRIQPELMEFPAALKKTISALIKERDLDVPEWLIAVSLNIGCLVHGIISMQISGRMTPIVGDGFQFYRLQVLNMLKQIGLEPAQV
ncbi:TetR/AcrR family transcriptional regulator [bacterium]|nr:TetR/AcrR family transcriptional regulator [bacterium]